MKYFFYATTGLVAWTKSRWDFNTQKDLLQQKFDSLDKENNVLDKVLLDDHNIKSNIVTLRGYMSIAASTSATLGQTNLVKLLGTCSTGLVYIENMIKEDGSIDTKRFISDSIHYLLPCIAVGFYQYKTGKFFFNNKFAMPTMIILSMLDFNFNNFHGLDLGTSFKRNLEDHQVILKQSHSNIDDTLNCSIKLRTVLSTTVTVNSYFKYIPTNIIKPIGFFMLTQAFAESYFATKDLEEQNQILGEYIDYFNETNHD